MFNNINYLDDEDMEYGSEERDSAGRIRGTCFR